VTSLWQLVTSTTKSAAREGVLVSLPTERVSVEDHGISFVVHVSTLQDDKDRAKTAQLARPFNPFLPPDPDLTVSVVPPHHLAVLNKFNVLRHHLLIVTREFEPQEALLNEADFSALLTCMAEIDGLGFYNGGVVAGASQSHKHLQLVPLPLGDGSHPTPVDPVIERTARIGSFSTVPVMSFTHTVAGLDGERLGPDRAKELHRLYLGACAEIGVHDESRPYNLLLTRRWMLVVRRSREHWHRVSINALGFAGSMLVRDRSELDRLRGFGPLEALRSVVEA
jgi:ATP adenylyltransferase